MIVVAVVVVVMVGVGVGVVAPFLSFLSLCIPMSSLSLSWFSFGQQAGRDTPMACTDKVDNTI